MPIGSSKIIILLLSSDRVYQIFIFLPMSCGKVPACLKTVIVLGIISYGIAMLTTNLAEYLDYDARQTRIKTQEKVFGCPDLCGSDYSLQKDTVTCCTADGKCSSREDCKVRMLAEMDRIKDDAAQQILLFSIIVGIVLICLCKIKCQPCRQLCIKEQQVTNQERGGRDSTVIDPINWEENHSEKDKKEEPDAVVDALKGSFYILNNQENCAICLQKLEEDKVIRLGCRHLFHGGCIREWIAKHNSCPVCRRPH